LTAVPASTSQVLIERAPSYGATSGTLTAWARGGSGSWTVVFGPWPTQLGFNGTAPAGSKREGDGRTPSGLFGFGFMFGVQPNPGVAFSWRPVHSDDFWDDDSASPSYNQWVVGRAAAGANPEPMDNPAPYAYGAVIAYNPARTPGNGSAIFLHVGTGGPTAGCISLPETDLLTVLRWLQPGRNPLISIAAGS
jgi:L,D-peptidoglycan transpeptidase YkuD (ErfK/YbiS/YcfS/YnhG family)